jgi:hypothetical protein
MAAGETRTPRWPAANAGLRRDQRTRAARAKGRKARDEPDLPVPAEQLARIVMSITGGLSVDELMEPESVRPELLGEALALIYAGLVARAQVSRTVGSG